MTRKTLLAAFAAASMSAFPVSGEDRLPGKSSFDIDTENLYELFRDPSPQYRPYARWWWNGLRLDENEILRELDIMKEMGLGGVEINSIRFPDEADTLGYKVMPYLSDDWARMVRVAADGCRDRGMVCDMIGGSGWPFGGEFLPREHQLQMLTVETQKVDGGSDGTVFTVSKDEILRRVDPPIMSRNSDPAKELMYIRLMPEKVDNFTEGIYYDFLAGEDDIRIEVPAGKHVIYFFVKMTGYMNVIEGAPGACGPVLNHFDKDAVLNYLERLSGCIGFNSPQMKGLVRAAFVDSFELEGANWSDTLLQEWEDYYGYSLMPYLPYVIRKVGHMGDPLPEDYGCEFSEEVKEDVIYRVRSDFEHFQIKLFQENFIETFNAWCHRNGLKSRIQAYGRALHPIETSMYIDIPECETWFRDGLWTDYKARISAVLQNSVPQSDVAILPPLEDMWSVLGQQRDPYPVNVYPDYAHDLWQNLHQNGNGCDYISENIIRQAKVRRGSLSFGPRSYRTVILMEVESMAPETALMLEKFVASGGKVLCIGKTPYQSIGFNDYKARSAKVKETVERIRSRYPDRFLTTASPEGSLTEWYRGVQQEFGITPYVKMDNPVKWVFCNYYKSGDRDLFFITNFNRLEGHSFNAVFPESVSGKNAWIWIPETGMRYRLPQDGNRMKVDLGPSESRFIVFDSEDGGQMYSPMPCRPENAFTLSGPWDVKAEHVDGSSREFSMDRLVDFNTLPFPWLRTFAGTVSYTKTVDVTDPEAFSVLDAGKVRGITELYVNGVKAGVCWYGDHRFDIGGLLKAGANTLTLKVVTPLGNYADSLVENRTAKRYAHTMKSLGLEEEVKLY